MTIYSIGTEQVRGKKGKLATQKVAREGKASTGRKLHFSCGFCKEYFLSRRQRNDHTEVCGK